MLSYIYNIYIYLITYLYIYHSTRNTNSFVSMWQRKAEVSWQRHNLWGQVLRHGAAHNKCWGFRFVHSHPSGHPIVAAVANSAFFFWYFPSPCKNSSKKQGQCHFASLFQIQLGRKKTHIGSKTPILKTSNSGFQSCINMHQWHQSYLAFWYLLMLCLKHLDYVWKCDGIFFGIHCRGKGG